MRIAYIVLVTAISVIFLTAFTPYFGVELLEPQDGSIDLGTDNATFSWKPWQGAERYQFQLAEDLDFNYMVENTTLTATDYFFDHKLKYGTTYFWRVRAVEIKGSEWPSDWSQAYFVTEDAPLPLTPVPAQLSIPVTVWVASGAASAVILISVIVALVRKALRGRPR